MGVIVEGLNSILFLLTLLNCRFELTRLELRLKPRQNVLTAALDEEFS